MDQAHSGSASEQIEMRMAEPVKITAIRASIHTTSIAIPLLEGKVAGYGREEQKEFVFCEVETDKGVSGFGLTGHFLARAVVEALEKHVFPAVQGMDPRDTEAIHQRVWWKLNPRAMTGTISSALSCLDIACWDIAGKLAGRTVAELLGGCRTAVPAYVTYGFPQYDHEQLAEAARMHVANGFKALKIVVAVDKGGWREDARRVRAAREAVGDDIDLMIDANYLFNPVEAKMLCRAIEDLNITWFEEPLHQNDARALADLRAHTRIPLAAGQMEGHRWRLRELVDRQAVDILQPNVCFCGGYTEARKAPGLCIGRGDIAMAQATHGSAPDIAGTGKANPYAMIESTRMLIEWLGRRRGIAEALAASHLMQKGIQQALRDPAMRTPDIRGTGRQRDMVNGILAGIAA